MDLPAAIVERLVRLVELVADFAVAIVSAMLTVAAILTTVFVLALLALWRLSRSETLAHQSPTDSRTVEAPAAGIAL